jgi:hypothetical protein
MLNDRTDNTQGFGFIDDTNIIAWGLSEEHNCRRLTAVHDECEVWARDHGARFAPDKYQLIHFTRSRRPTRGTPPTSIRIAGQVIQAEEKAIKVLGVWLDPKLSWKEHIAHAARKGLAASEALARLATSTWGPSTRNTRLLYIATVRPILLYSSHEWSIRIANGTLPKSRIDPIAKVQNKCLRRITGGYKRTPRAALEREACVPPLDIAALRATRAKSIRTARDPVERSIEATADRVWRSLRGTRQRRIDIPQLARNQARDIARETIEKERDRMRTAHEQRGSRRLWAPPPNEICLRKIATKDWKARWDDVKHRRMDRNPPATWTTAWEQDRRKLYAGLSKAEATALFLMRTEVIGLNAWLASIGVPNIDPRCPCGQQAQTVRHVVLHCQRHEREGLIRECQTARLDEMLSRPGPAQHTARWLLATGTLQHLRLAKEIEEEDVAAYAPLESCERW